MSIKPRLTKLNNRGDTIVEVMIVLAVLGLAIGISYATANSALLQARQAQENSKATALLQGQVEKLRTMAANPQFNADGVTPNTDGYIFRSGDFCISSSNKVVDASDAECHPPVTPDVGYAITIKYCGGSGDPACAGHTTDDTFLFKATWPNVQGQGDDTAGLTYRIHKP